MTAEAEDKKTTLPPLLDRLIEIMNDTNRMLRHAMIPAQVIHLNTAADQRVYEARVEWDDGHRQWVWSAIAFGGAVSLANCIVTTHLLQRVESVVDDVCPDTEDEYRNPYIQRHTVTMPGHDLDPATGEDIEDAEDERPPLDRRLN